jgi:hypothetical protein
LQTFDPPQMPPFHFLIEQFCQMRKTVKTHTLNGRCRTVTGGEKTGE